MKNILKKAGIIILVLIGVLTLYRVIAKILQAGEKTQEPVYAVGIQELKKEKIKEVVSFQGVIEGDPQVKVYSKVPGKFEKKAKNEGDRVKKGDTLFYINRDVTGFDFKLARVNSPASGILTKLYYVDKGSFIDPQKPVGEVANPEKIKVILSAGESSLVKVKKGMKARIKAVYNGGGSIDGVVYSVTPFIDRETLSGTVIVKADNPGAKVKIGMTASVEIESDERDVFMVPERAVLMGEGRTYVYINEGGAAKPVDVETGYLEGRRIEISGGLKQGDKLVTDGNFKLFEGAKITTEEKIKN